MWDEFISADNFSVALRRAVRGRYAKRSVARFLNDAERNLEKIRMTVASGGFKTSEYKTMELFDPKKKDHIRASIRSR
ncbi:MAG: hypothetical protein FWD33_04060 [Alphaproteobacteria bacterium]|nr:hypothetical protein [Alphaproteobacteria bacterium]